MQPTERYSVPRRPLEVDDYIDILRRHKSWVFGPLLFTLVASVVGAFLWPNSYESRAVVQIIPQRLPDTMVQAAINTDMTERINTMANAILSRAALTTIVRNFDLYKRELNSIPIDDVVEQMRGEIDIAPILLVPGAKQRFPAFSITFTYEDRRQAQKVVQELVTRFMDQNTQDRNLITYQTQEFFKDQAEGAQRDLEAVQARLTQFRVNNYGRLPDQLPANLQQLTALQQQASTLLNAINRLQSDKATLETQIRVANAEIEELKQEATVVRSEETKNLKLDQVNREIEILERDLTELLRRYKDTYPDVRIARSRRDAALQRREALIAEQEQSKQASGPEDVPVNVNTARVIRDLEGRVQQWQSLIENHDRQIEQYNAQINKNSDAITQFSGRIQAVPVSEQEYTDLIRDEAMARENYEKMNGKLESAQIAYEMESRKQGETLEMLDPPTLPINPTAPRRGLVVGAGAGLGLVLGLVMAGAREMKDTSLKNLKDVRAYTQMAILGSVPLLENDFVVRRRKRIAWLGWTTACLAAAVAMASSVVYYVASHS